MEYRWGHESKYLQTLDCRETTCNLKRNTNTILTRVISPNNVDNPGQWFSTLDKYMPGGWNRLAVLGNSGMWDINQKPVAPGVCAYWTFVPLYRHVTGLMSNSDPGSANNPNDCLHPNLHHDDHTEEFFDIARLPTTAMYAVGTPQLVSDYCGGDNYIDGALLHKPISDPGVLEAPYTVTDDHNKSPVRKSMIYWGSERQTGHTSQAELGTFDGNAPYAIDCLHAAGYFFDSLLDPQEVNALTVDWTNGCENFPLGPSNERFCARVARSGTCEARIEYTHKQPQDAVEQFRGFCEHVDTGIDNNTDPETPVGNNFGFLAAMAKLFDQAQGGDGQISGDVFVWTADRCQIKLYFGRI
ncbi:hypothetical protein LTR66_016910 [Elasticomyces elasticus]|nr:hypothetical protein LTR66_016910 [Elasticomyces elasticus]